MNLIRTKDHECGWPILRAFCEGWGIRAMREPLSSPPQICHPERISAQQKDLPRRSRCVDARTFQPRLLTFLLFTFLTAAATAQTVVKLTLHDTVQPVTAAYLQRGLNAAAAQHADAVLLSLGTPGGLLSSPRQLVPAIEPSPVRVTMFIEPTAARAGSAGFFLLASADIAARAPGTNAGAAL